MKLRKKRLPPVQPPQVERRASEPSQAHPSNRMNRRATAPSIDSQTGERIYSFDSETSTLVGEPRPYDIGELMHSLTRDRSIEDLAELYMSQNEYRNPGEFSIASLPASLWERIASFLSLADSASLALANSILRARLDGDTLWRKLNNPANKVARLDFLFRLDKYMPLHLLCTPCATFHQRIRMGREQYKADFVANPLYLCPKVYDTWLPRMRLTYGRELPFSFIQLATRQRNFGSLHGIPASSLDRRWKCSASEWSHATRFVVVKGNLLMRVISQCIAPPNMMDTERRMLLLDRMDYNPYFSVCAHWKSGELMKVCKCAVSHIPEPPERIRDQLKQGRGPSINARNRNFAVSQCENCRDIRRCPQCPTEYLIQIKLVEDTGPTGRPSFKHALQITRWSDLGNGSSPMLSSEWASCCGFDPDGVGKFDSFAAVGNRTLSGKFEAETNNHLFLKRVVSLDPGRGKPKPFRFEEWI
ncbi:uncharacterized protein PV09_04334 [Verruconis gallopava]|uniref:F-box domain-containing protein n=1 Tax=Verruconis gallopava TaxID=253628 RepID=A0A0D2ADP6_9PEZI|nr:uncharacterized protein PV09_04334 [Verruconis gallopava]KIW04585.1 hypothetical protein PV09_04334 [Verruconis gallopava]